MKWIRAAIISVFYILLTPHCGIAQSWTEGQSSLTSNFEDVLKQIRPEAIRAHIMFLADDALEGRGTGTRGYLLGAKYVRSHFMASGIRGGSVNGEYFQKVPLVRTSIDESMTTMHFEVGEHLEYGKDFLVLDSHGSVEGRASAKVVFVGYGVTAPEFGYDDYSGLDVSGAIVAFLDFEAPPSFPPAVRAYYCAHDVKVATAAEHGAIGAVYVRSPETETRFPWDFMLREVENGWNSLRWVNENERPSGISDQIKIMGMLNRSAAEILFAGEEHEFGSLVEECEKGTPPRFVLSKTMTVEYRARHKRVECVNVVGQLKGSDAKLKSEYVVYSAHADHLGIGPPVKGDSIYNGAVDNASGCAVLLEVARAFAELRKRPRRSILFVILTGEEAGLLGSDYFVHNPSVPIGSIASNINMDGAISLVPVGDVIAWGAEHSTIGAVAQQVGNKFHIPVSPDPLPEEGLFARADQFSFVKQGIPSLFLGVGVHSQKPGVDALAEFKQWLVTTYHSPKDDITQPLEYETSARYARFAFILGHTIATDSRRPHWNKGDFFGSRFGHR